MQKNNMEECIATGLYPLRVASISRSVLEADSCFAKISSDRTFDEDRTSIAVSSSRMFPYKAIGGTVSTLRFSPCRAQKNCLSNVTKQQVVDELKVFKL